MTLRIPYRVGLAAVVFALLLGVFLSVPTFNASFAQAPAATPAEPAAPACDPKMLLNCSPNSGDTAWMLTSWRWC